MAAAFYHDRFGSPLLATMFEPVNSAWTNPVAIREVCIDIVDPGQDIWDICGTVDWDNAGTGDDIDQDCAINHGNEYDMESIRVSRWDDPGFGGFVATETLDATGFNWGTWYAGGGYIGDPPNAGSGDVVQEIARRLRGSFFSEVELVETNYSGGQPVDSTSSTARVQTRSLSAGSY